MPSIVEYTDQRAAENRYPERIISPSRPDRCCFKEMEEIGEPAQEGQWIYRYKRCRTCGFTVRTILRQVPDAALIAELRRVLETSFQRNVPEG